MNNYSKACTEVSTILSYLNIEEYKKIPKEVIEAIEKAKNKEYVFIYVENVELRKQKLLEETRAILFNLFRDYLCTKEQKEKIIKMQQEERNRLNEVKEEKYSYNDIFKKKVQNNEKEETINETTNALTVKKENIIIKIINKIKSFFKNI